MTAPPGTGSSISVPTGAPPPDWTQWLTTDPFYLGNVQTLTDDRDTTLENLARAETDDVALFKLDQELAQRTNAQREKYLREFGASRGMLNSGQQGADQAERQFQFLNNQSQLGIQQEADIFGFGQGREQANTAWARGQGAAAIDLFNRLKADGSLNVPSEMALWDEESQLYVTKGGQYYDAYGGKVDYKKPPPPPPVLPPGVNPSAPSTAPGFYDPVPGDPEENRSRPSENLIPGTGWGYE